MEIAVSSTGQTLDDAVEARFGRCPYFLIVNPATLEFEVIANANAELGVVLGFNRHNSSPQRGHR